MFQLCLFFLMFLLLLLSSLQEYVVFPFFLQSARPHDYYQILRDNVELVHSYLHMFDCGHFTIKHQSNITRAALAKWRLDNIVARLKNFRNFRGSLSDLDFDIINRPLTVREAITAYVFANIMAEISQHRITDLFLSHALTDYQSKTLRSKFPFIRITYRGITSCGILKKSPLKTKNTLDAKIISDLPQASHVLEDDNHSQTSDPLYKRKTRSSVLANYTSSFVRRLHKLYKEAMPSSVTGSDTSYITAKECDSEMSLMRDDSSIISVNNISATPNNDLEDCLLNQINPLDLTIKHLHNATHEDSGSLPYTILSGTINIPKNLTGKISTTISPVIYDKEDISHEIHELKISDSVTNDAFSDNLANICDIKLDVTTSVGNVVNDSLSLFDQTTKNSKDLSNISIQQVKKNSNLESLKASFDTFPKIDLYNGGPCKVPLKTTMKKVSSSHELFEHKKKEVKLSKITSERTIKNKAKPKPPFYPPNYVRDIYKAEASFWK